MSDFDRFLRKSSKRPVESVIAPMLLPFTEIFAYTSGCLVSLSTTVPVMVCEKAQNVERMNEMNRVKFLMVSKFLWLRCFWLRRKILRLYKFRFYKMLIFLSFVVVCFCGDTS